MSLYTHWACFGCRKSFHKLPPGESSSDEVEAHRCPECGGAMRDMGVYFEPPPKRAKGSWGIAQLLADSGYKFQSEGGVAYIKTFILGSKRPRIEDVRRNIELAKRSTEEARAKARLREHKEEKKGRRIA